MGKNRDINVAVIGNTGDGKSTLINAVLDLDISETGAGRPVTQDIFAYRVPRSSLCLFDTKGFEIEQSKETVDGIIEFIKKRQINNVEQSIHCVWLCTNSQGERWQDVHKALIKVVKDLSIPCIVVITQCYGGHEKYVEYVERNVPENVLVFPVLAKALELPGARVEASGIDNLKQDTERIGTSYKSRLKKEKALSKSASVVKKTIGSTFIVLGVLLSLVVGLAGFQDCGNAPFPFFNRNNVDRYEACKEQNETAGWTLAIVLGTTGFIAWYTFMRKKSTSK